mmetsp:Transcript_6603/g.16690  ORF Transcript_6603/g.16690 Transcript_6603/m.16690 type:complete len:221 (+) Transcript_6603:498-1160(+)
MNSVSPLNEMIECAESATNPSLHMMAKKRKTEKNIENTTSSLYLPSPSSSNGESYSRRWSIHHLERISPPPPSQSSQSSLSSSPSSSQKAPSSSKQKKTVRWSDDDLSRWTSEDSKNRSHGKLNRCLPTKPTRSYDLKSPSVTSSYPSVSPLLSPPSSHDANIWYTTACRYHHLKPERSHFQEREQHHHLHQNGSFLPHTTSSSSDDETWGDDSCVVSEE